MSEVTLHMIQFAFLWTGIGIILGSTSYTFFFNRNMLDSEHLHFWMTCHILGWPLILPYHLSVLAFHFVKIVLKRLLSLK